MPFDLPTLKAGAPPAADNGAAPRRQIFRPPHVAFRLQARWPAEEPLPPFERSLVALGTSDEEPSASATNLRPSAALSR